MKDGTKANNRFELDEDERRIVEAYRKATPTARAYMSSVFFAVYESVGNVENVQFGREGR